MLKRVVHSDRRCDWCGQGYWRVNRSSIWTIRNPGSRIGWSKVTIKLCNDCFSVSAAARSVMAMSLRLVDGKLFKAGAR